MLSKVVLLLLCLPLAAAASPVGAFAAAPGLGRQLALRGGARATSPTVMSAAAGQKIVVKKPDEKEKEIASNWATWGCEASKFPWSYSQSETCLLITGEVIVTPDGGEPVEVLAQNKASAHPVNMDFAVIRKRCGKRSVIKAGDMATFPAGMSCTWDVKKAVSKHYNFRASEPAPQRMIDGRITNAQ